MQMYYFAHLIGLVFVGLVCRAQDMFGPMNDGEPFLLLD